MSKSSEEKKDITLGSFVDMYRCQHCGEEFKFIAARTEHEKGCGT